jgi:hypothetical protein
MYTPLHASKSRIYAPIILGLAIFVGIFMTKPLYEWYLLSVTERMVTENEYEEKAKVLESLTAMKKQLESQWTGTTELTDKVNKLTKKWDSADIMAAVMLNEFTLSNSLTSPRISIGSISTSKGSKLPSGLWLWSVSVSVSARTLDDMITYITYLTQTSPFVFTIDEISLPIDTGASDDTSNDSISLALSLGVYHYE